MSATHEGPEETSPARLALGTPVSFAAVLERKSQPSHGQRRTWAGDDKVWMPVKRAGTGFVTGYRTLVNGYTNHSEDGPEWCPIGTVRCVLVAFSLYRVPACVPLDAITPSLVSPSSSDETINETVALRGMGAP